MANKKIQATATLFLDTKDAQSDAKKFVNDLKQKLSEVETAADKMTVFKDMVAYIAQVDRALAALRKNNKDAFNSMFDGLDFNLKQQLEGLFGVNGAQLGQVEVLREKLNTLTLKSSIKEIRTFAKEINALFTSIGVSAPFDNIDEQFSGRTNTGHIQALATSLANFATVWEDLSARVSQGFGGAGGSGSGVFGGLNNEVQEAIDKLKKQKEEYQQVIDAINKKPIKINITTENDAEELEKLINAYREIQKKTTSSDFTNLSFEEQNKLLAERVRLATLLKNTSDHIIDNDGSNEAFDMATSGDGMRAIESAETFLDNFYNDSKGKAEELRKLYIGLVSDIDSQLRTLQGPSTSYDVKDTVSLYDKLNEKMREYFELKKQLANVEKDTPEYDKLQDRQRAIQDEVLTLKKLSEEQEDSLYGIFDDIDETDVPFKNALTNICDTLGVEIPQAANQAGEQIDTFGKKIVNVSEYVSALSGQLKEMFAAAGRSANFEYHIAIDGLDIKARHGSEKSVDLATQTETYLDTLFSDSVLYGHSHRGGTSATNIYDIEAVLSSYRDGVSIPVHFVVGKDSITTMDFTGLSKDMANQLMQEIAATNSNKNAPVINESINKIVEKFTGNSGALKTWNVEQFDDLAKYIYDVSSAASSALTPIEKFQAVLDNMFGKGKVDATQYESLLSDLDKNNVKNIFNQIASIENLQPIKTTDMLTMGQVNAEIDESIAKYKTLREEANLSYSDIRNEVDKVIEHYNAGGSATSGLDFFQKYFPEGEWQNVRNLLTDAYDNLISIEEVTNRIAGEFGVDPDTFAQIPNGVQTSQIVDETNQKLREQEQLWENVKIAIKNGIGEVVGIDDMAIALEVIEGEIKEGILTSLEECIARFKEFNNISEEDSLTLIGRRERVIEDRYDTYLSGYDEVVSKEEADKLRQLSIQQEQLYQNLRSAIKGTLSDIVDVDDMTYAFDTLEKEIEAGLLTTLDQCIERFKLLIGLDDKRLTSIKDDQRVADSWDYYQGNRYVDDGETVIDSSEYNKFLNERAELLERISSLQSKIDGMPDTYFTEGDFESSVQEYCVEIDKLQNELAELKVSYEVLKDVNQFATEDLVDYEREVADLNKTIEDLQTKLSNKTSETGTSVGDANAMDDNSLIINSEVAQLELLQQKLLEVKTAVDAKTQAFEEEYVTVDAAVDAEIASLNKLKDLLVEIQGILQTVFSVGGMNLGDVELSKGKENANTASTAIQGIQQTLQQILAVLQGFTGLEADGKNSITHKEATAKTPANNANVMEPFVSKLNDLATEGTLSKIPAAIDELADAIGNKTKAESDTHANTINALDTLISALNANIKSLQDVMGGVVEHQKSQKSDTTKAMARIQDPDQYKQISSIAENSIGDLGADVQIKSLKALANGLVSVEGAFKNVDGEWEGFTVKVNESNKAVDLAVNKYSSFAKVMKKLEEEMEKASNAVDDNNRKLSPDNTAMLARATAMGYDDEGKEVTVQYKDSQRYTVSLKENIGGLQKEVFQTFDDSIEDFNERTTVTVSNKTAAAIRETNNLIEENAQKVGNVDLLTKYNAEYQKLLSMNQQYRYVYNFSDDDIDAWNKQITLVQTLGNEVSSLIKQQQKLDSQSGVATSAKKLQEYQTKADNIFKGLDFDLTSEIQNEDQQAIVDTYSEIIEQINLLKKSHSVLTDTQIAELNNLISTLDAVAGAYKNTLGGVFTSKRGEALSKFNLEKATLQADINIPDSFNERLNNIKTAIESAADDDALKIAINDWKALQNEIKQAAVEQDLYIKKTKDIKSDKFTKNKTAQVNAFDKYTKDLKDADYGVENLSTKLEDLKNKLLSIDDQASLDAWITEFEQLQGVVDNAKTGFVKQNDTIIDKVQKQLSGSFNRLDPSQQLTLLTTYSEVMGKLAQQRKNVQNGQSVTLAGIQAITKALQEQIEVQLKANKAANTAEQTQKKNGRFGATAEINVTAKHNSLIDAVSNKQFENSSSMAAALKGYEDAYEKFTNELKNLRNSNNQVTKEEEVNFKNLTTECNKAAASLEKVIKNTMELKSKQANTEDYMLGADFVDDEAGRAAALSEFVKKFYDINVAASDFRNNYNEVVFAVDKGNGTFTQMKATFTAARNEIVALAGDTNKVQGKFESFIDGVKNRLQSLSQYFIATVGIYDVWNVIKQGINHVREIDLALTELKKVTDETDASYSRFLQDMSKTGSVIGATVADLTTSAADWARLGYTMQEAGELAKNTSILMNVSEFDDVNQATETLISALQAFKKEGQDVGVFSMEIIDKYNEVGNNYAISTSDLAESLTRSSAALVAANNSLEQSIAMTAAANTTIQDPESVGNALKTVSMRIRGVKTELEEAGEDTEGMVTNTAKLQEKIMALTNIDGSGGVNILTNSGDFKSTYDILLEISKVWKDMGDTEQAALLELVAGKTRGSVVAALFQNGDVLEKAYDSALNASGSAMNELNNHLDSIQGRIDLFNNALQTFWMNLINSDVVKGVVDVGTMLIKFVDTFIGKLTTIVAIFTVYTKFKSKLSFADMFESVVKSSKGALSSIQKMISATQSLTKADLARALASKGIEKALVRQIIAEAGLKGVTGALTNEQIKATAATLSAKFATGELTTAQYLATMSTMGFKTALQGLWTVLMKNPFVLIAAAAALVGVALDGITTTAREAADAAKEAFDEIQSVVDSTTSTIQSLESELSTLNDRIEELDGKDLSFVDTEELNRLKKQRTELEHSLKVQKQLLELQTNSRNKQAVASMEAYTKAASQGAEETTKTSKAIGTVIGVLGGLAIGAGALFGVFTGGASAAAGLGVGTKLLTTAALMGGFGFAGNKVGELAGSKISENDGTYDSWYKTYTKAIETARAEEEKALADYQKDSSNIEKLDKWRESQQKTIDIETEMYNHLSQMQQYYSGIEYGTSDELDAELDKWNNFLDKFSIEQGATDAKVNALDRIFGENANKEIKTIKKQILDAVNAGKKFDFSSAINGSQELKNQLEYVGLEAKDVEDYFTKIGEATRNPEFDITKYSQDIKSHSSVISEFQDAIQSLEKGTFTMDDFLDLIERFPELAKGVDISSNAFLGLSRNLNKAIRTRTKSFVNDLKELKKSLVEAGKSSESIDQLIEAIENMPDDALDNTIEKYVTLADEIERARVAQDKLTASMEENPNEGYESRGEALDYMKEAMSKGEIGSESNLWNVAQKYGFTYDSAKTINENADALAKFIAVREKWWKTEDDGDDRTNDGYSFEGTKNFIESVEKVVKSSEEAGTRLSEILKWDYNEKTGSFDFDFDNENLDEIISLLSKTQELAGLTTEEWMDLMVQVGQYFNVNWGDADDVIDHITKISEGSGTAADKIDEMTDSVETYVEKALRTDLDFSNLTQASVDALDCDDSIKQLLKTYLTLKQSLEDPLNIEAKLEENGTVDSLLEIKELQSSIKNGSHGYTIIDTDAFTTVLKEAGYTEDKINDLITKVQEYQSVITVNINDPLGLNSQNSSITSVMSALEQLGLEYEITKEILGQPAQVNITSKDLITTLQEKGWTSENIAAYLATLTSAENSLGITVDGKVTMNKDEIDAAIAAADQVPERENTEYTVSGTGTSVLDGIVSSWSKVPEVKSTAYSIYETTYKSTVSSPYLGNANGTAHAQGTAYNSGSWGAPQTETSLVGELGPELLVRNGRWTTVGEHGAEFTQVKKGDIIFNHKQTESLLKNGYVTGRGRAYASGTAYAAGGGTYNRYEFSGNGGYNKYDVNNNIVDKFGNAASDISDAAKDASDDTEQMVDFIEMKLEEIEAIIEKTTNRITNFLDDTTSIKSKDELYDELIKAEKEKSEVYLQAAQKYNVEAAAALSGVPQQYQEMARNGAIAIEDFVGEDQVEIAEKIEKYRELAAKADEAENGHLETIAAISAHRVEQLEDIATDFENIISISKSHSDLLQAEMDLVEESGNRLSESYYEELKIHSQKQLDDMQNERVALQKILDDAVAAGDVVIGSDDWYSMLETIYEVDQEIIDCKTSLEEFQNAINDLYWDNFDKLIAEIDAVDSELSNLFDLISDTDKIVDDMGNWTADGYTALGLLVQQMEVAQQKSEEYGDAISKLKKDYKDGLYSTDEYNEKLAELTDGQYDAIKSYEDAKDAIIDLNKTRVEAVKDGLSKEIESYQKLIEAKKEALNADKD